MNVAKLKNIDLFQVFIGQINKLNKLVGELFPCCLTVTIVAIHESSSFLLRKTWGNYLGTLFKPPPKPNESKAMTTRISHDRVWEQASS